MARKRALVVDDSRSARQILRKMLERHELDVDTVESAEEALEYLLHNHPNVIFMDHMMPGMDGFQAVKVIKSDPRTATIPVMMYTSKEGEVYVGEARALGAVGVLPKEVKPAVLAQVLENLRLLPGQGGPEPAANRQAPAEEPPLPPPPTPRIELLAREAAEDAFQRFLRGALQDLRTELRTELREDLREELRAATADDPWQPPPRPYRAWAAAALATLVLAVPAGFWLGRYSSAPQSATASLQTVEAVRPTAMSDDNASLLRNLAMQRLRSDGERAQLLKTLEWALNEAGRYDFGQVPFGEERLAVLSELLTRLSSAGFAGTIRLDSHVGQFCLVRDEHGDLRPAPPELPVSRCDSIGYERNQALAAAGRQSLAFANFLTSSPILRDGRIRVELMPRGDEQPRFEYPQTLAGIEAGHWNSIARRNQRVEFALIPASSTQ